jgi:hypothetical protein
MSLRFVALAGAALIASAPAFAQTADAPSWGGFTAAVYMPVYISGGPVPGIGGALGFSFNPGRFVIGAEVTAAYSFFDTPDTDVVGRARIGVVIGGEFLAYGALGVGHFWDGEGGGATYIKASLGGELAVTNRVSIRSELSAFRYAPGVIDTGIAGGLVFHFGG